MAREKTNTLRQAEGTIWQARQRKAQGNVVMVRYIEGNTVAYCYTTGNHRERRMGFWEFNATYMEVA